MFSLEWNIGNRVHTTVLLGLWLSSPSDSRMYVAADDVALSRTAILVSKFTAAKSVFATGQDKCPNCDCTSSITSRPPCNQCWSLSLLRRKSSMALSIQSTPFAFAELESTSHARGTRPSDRHAPRTPATTQSTTSGCSRMIVSISDGQM